MRQKIGLIANTYYKTKKCKQYFDVGYCSYGTRCQFLHCDSSVKIFSYKKTIDLLNDKNYKEISELKRPRLKTFENLCKEPFSSNSNNINSLYNEVVNLKKHSTDDEDKANVSFDYHKEINEQSNDLFMRNRFMSN
jgi:hypothetical protein